MLDLSNFVTKTKLIDGTFTMQAADRFFVGANF